MRQLGRLIERETGEDSERRFIKTFVMSQKGVSRLIDTCCWSLQDVKKCSCHLTAHIRMIYILSKEELIE